MDKKLNCVLLIDDDEATNYFNTLILQQVNCAEKIECCVSGAAALEFLREGRAGSAGPDLIFLDINMPGMNGFEFLDAYEKLPDFQKGNVVIMMLTTSLNPEDAEKSEGEDNVRGFITKPLTEETVRGILEEHFSDRFEGVS